jgi:ATP-dependent exoDNAse (exonuclease V) alpha subunit
MEFDLLIIDEASQVRPEDALGVIARAKQMVVVGDAKQLPPTNFFNRLLSDEEVDEDDDNDMGGETDALTGAVKIAELECSHLMRSARSAHEDASLALQVEASVPYRGLQRCVLRAEPVSAPLASPRS